MGKPGPYPDNTFGRAGCSGPTRIPFKPVGRLRPRSVMLWAAAYLFLTGSACHAADYTFQPLQSPSLGEPGAKPFYRFTPEETGITSVNTYNDPRMWGELFRELTLGAVETGLAVADFNNDGKPDIYTVSKNGPCSLYLQTGNFKFEDVAESAGVAANETTDGKAGATAVDINQDGWMDIYLCRYDAPNLLFINQGNGRFIEEAEAYGLAIRDASVHAGFADYDRDGDLDAYLVTNILRFAENPRGRADYLLRNNGDGTFSDVAGKSGIWGISQGHTAIWFDSNHDGWPDLYVANDFETPDRFYINQGDGTFVDGVDDNLPHVTYFSMGADSGDLNNDGLVDFFVADMRDRTRGEYMAGMEEMGRGLWEMERVNELVPQYMWNSFYLNSGTEYFKEMAFMAGMEATGWTWATRMADFDCDGLLDVFFTNGMIRNFVDADLVDRQKVVRTLEARAAVWKNAPVRNEPNVAYRNQGNLSFKDVSADWGLDHNGVSFGCATADLDGDGDLDLIYTNYNAPASVVRNDLSTGNRLVIKLEGRAPNRQGIGAEVSVTTSSGIQTRQVFTERGIVSSEPARLYFGLGNETSVERIHVRWPDGGVSTLKNIPAGNLLTLSQPESDSFQDDRQKPANAPLFKETAKAHGLNFTSSLKRVDELGSQRLLPRRLNGQGPGLASADVNGDGTPDIFVTGSTGQSGMLFLGKQDGSFEKAYSQPWADASEADDLGALFLDVNGDQAPDLLIAAGGVSAQPGDPLLNNRLYLNDGNGRYYLAESGTLPPDGQATKALAAADFDADGDLDLFVGGRYVPGKWPDTPRSFLYENQEGKFVDVSEKLAPGISFVGMVTGAAFSDLDSDNRPDLILSLEWGPITIFMNSGNGFHNQTDPLGLSGKTGWWNTVAVADFNQDGRLDIAAGNLGLNTKYKGTTEAPATLFAGPFGDPGKTHILEAQYEDRELYPIRGLSKLRYSFPKQTRRFRTFKDFSQVTLEDIFGKEALHDARKLEATELASGIFFQQADGHFEFTPLPPKAQLAPIFTFSALDVTGNNSVDLFLAGNHFGPEPTTGRFDGSLGLLLTNDGKGILSPVGPKRSGIAIPGEVRASTVLSTKAKSDQRLLIARTNGPLLLFESSRP